MKNVSRQILLGSLLVLFWVSMAAAHCEIPCGIYDDRMRIQMVSEHIDTIQKSMNQITALQKEKPINYNQLVRWIMNKEDHANQLQEIVTQYFMTQRIKTDRKNYAKEISLLHQMLVYAMKCKQTTDSANTEKLKSLLKQFEDVYFDHDH